MTEAEYKSFFELTLRHLISTHKRHPIAHPYGWAMEHLLWGFEGKLDSIIIAWYCSGMNMNGRIHYCNITALWLTPSSFPYQILLCVCLLNSHLSIQQTAFINCLPIFKCELYIRNLFMFEIIFIIQTLAQVLILMPGHDALLTPT